jgi:ornithine carbamoyltransferase
MLEANRKMETIVAESWVMLQTPAEIQKKIAPIYHPYTTTQRCLACARSNRVKEQMEGADVSPHLL